MKILAVDDEPLFLDILEVALRDLGHTDFTPAFSAQSALRELEEGKAPFDCILLDIRMPGMDGIALCRAIRSVAGYRRVPIMMVTSLADRRHIDEAFAAGATDYLSKPLDMLELKARIGVMERLLSERARVTLLEYRNASPEDREAMMFDFATPLSLDGHDRMIERAALENYLVSLGRKESYAISAFSISIVNAQTIFSAGTRTAFMNLLADTASCIDEALGTTPAVVSYVGSGNFIVVPTGPHEPVDTAALQARINQSLAGFTEIYVVDRIPRPEVRVGAEVRRNLFSRFKVVNLLDRAVASVPDDGHIAAARQARRA